MREFMPWLQLGIAVLLFLDACLHMFLLHKIRRHETSQRSMLDELMRAKDVLEDANDRIGRRWPR